MAVDFSIVSNLAKASVFTYGTPALYVPAAGAARSIKVIGPYREKDGTLLQDAPSAPANFLLNPNDFALRLPEQFETLQISSGTFTRTYAIESVDWITAGPELALLQIRAKGG